ncbi:flagellar biosynthetic protein FliR [Kiloniella sp. b19]|uniref:flagellar biosynthetic protein FliR n=1 Tax=Kiloniella sp. GXU_MW_B19 TaxID=3141326 RepID=UPI0031DA1B83
MLVDVLPASVYVFFVVFTRLAACIALLPGMGESYVSMRSRLALALVVTFVLVPVLENAIPPEPATVAPLVLLIAGEATVGTFIGLIARAILGATATAGMIVANMISLANAFTQDATQAQQASIVGSFLSAVALVVIFATGLHHMFFRALVDSYSLFIPGEAIPFADVSMVMSMLVNNTFALAVQMALPFIVVGMVFFIGLGFMAKLMPQMQVFFVAMPAQILLGLVVFLFSMTVMMRSFVLKFEEIFASMLSGQI